MRPKWKENLKWVCERMSPGCAAVTGFVSFGRSCSDLRPAASCWALLITSPFYRSFFFFQVKCILCNNNTSNTVTQCYLQPKISWLKYHLTNIDLKEHSKKMNREKEHWMEWSCNCGSVAFIEHRVSQFKHIFKIWADNNVVQNYKNLNNLSIN